MSNFAPIHFYFNFDFFLFQKLLAAGNYVLKLLFDI